MYILWLIVMCIIYKNYSFLYMVGHLQQALYCIVESSGENVCNTIIYIRSMVKYLNISLTIILLRFSLKSQVHAVTLTRCIRNLIFAIGR